MIGIQQNCGTLSAASCAPACGVDYVRVPVLAVTGLPQLRHPPDFHTSMTDSANEMTTCPRLRPIWKGKGIRCRTYFSKRSS